MGYRVFGFFPLLYLVRMCFWYIILAFGLRNTEGILSGRVGPEFGPIKGTFLYVSVLFVFVRLKDLPPGIYWGKHATNVPPSGPDIPYAVTFTIITSPFFHRWALYLPPPPDHKVYFVVI